jgi:hypothetical protein
MQIAIGSASKNARAVVQRLQIEPDLDALVDGYSVVRLRSAQTCLSMPPACYMYASTNTLSLRTVDGTVCLMPAA